MSDPITITYEGDYIHAKLDAEVSNYKLSLELWKRVVAACEKHQCFNILGEGNYKELDTMDGYQHKDIVILAGITLKHRIAWVHCNQDGFADAEFVKNVVQNRGLANGEIFNDVEAAKAWLLDT